MTMPRFSKQNRFKSGLPILGANFPDFFQMEKHYIMRSDVKETDTTYQLDVELPGFAKENIKAYMDNGYLVIEAAEVKDSDKDSKKYIQKERYEGTYRRTFYVGSTVRQEDIKAAYKHGVLHIHIPKKAMEDTGSDEIAIS